MWLERNGINFVILQMAALDAMIALFKGNVHQVTYMVKCGALQHLLSEFHYSSRKCMVSTGTVLLNLSEMCTEIHGSCILLGLEDREDECDW